MHKVIYRHTRVNFDNMSVTDLGMVSHDEINNRVPKRGWVFVRDYDGSLWLKTDKRGWECIQDAKNEIR